MKKSIFKQAIPFILSFFILAACDSSEKSGSDIIQLSFQMDTVMIDPKDELVYLNNNLYGAKITQDRRYIYNYNWRDFAIEKVNLDDLVFDKRISLAKEGPNGVGDFVTDFLIVGNGQLLLSGRNNFFLVDEEGSLKEKVDFMLDPESGLLSSDFLGAHRIFNPEDLILYGVLMNWEENFYQISKVDLNNKAVEKFDQESFDKLKDYKVSFFMEGRPSGGYGPSVMVGESSEKIIFNMNVSNEAVSINKEDGTFQYHSFQSGLFPNLRKKPAKTEVESMEELQRIVTEMGSEIEFSSFFSDDSGNYYRFSYFNKPKVDEEEETSTVVFLSIFDEELNLTAESKVDLIDFRPSFFFFKDGRVWLFRNMDDEMGFLRLKVIKENFN